MIHFDLLGSRSDPVSRGIASSAKLKADLTPSKDAMQPSYSELQRFSPYRVPDWRWRRACHLHDCRQHFSHWREDEETAHALAYRRALERCHSGRDQLLVKRWLALEAARRLAESDGPLRWEIQGRILAGQNDVDIGDCCGLTADTIRCFEAIFFHVRDRLVKGRDWIATHVLGPSQGLGRIWMAFGYYTGVDLFEVIMAASQDRPLPARVIQSCTGDRYLFEVRVRLSGKLAIAAMQIPANVPLRQIAELHFQARQMDSAQNSVAMNDTILAQKVSDSMIAGLGEAAGAILRAEAVA